MDKETVIKGCENWVNNHKGENFLLTYSSVVELLAVLKEQEAVEPIFECEEPTLKIGQFHCGYCHQSFGISHYRFCPFCGKQMRWK